MSDVRTRPAPSPTRVIAAACVGNALEWYDIAVYAFFAVYVSRAFFDDSDPAVGLLLALGTFAVSFLIRPVGALVLGGYADRVGRTPALSLSLALMVLGTLMIVVMPTYASIGVWASIGILVARLVQGFAAGGEFGSATAMMVEHLPHRRGFAASWQFTSQAVSSLLAAVIGTLLTTLMSDDALQSWGFRIPFAVGLLVGPVGIYIRRRVPEAEPTAAAQADTEPRTPVREVLAAHKVAVLLTIGALAVTTCLNYMISYIPTYAINTLGLADSAGFVATLVGGLVLLVVSPLSGHLSDRSGPTRIMLPGAAATLLLIYPLFALMVSTPGLGVLVVVVGLMALLKGAYYGPLGMLMADLFPTRVRATGMAVGYNIGVAVFGGATPLVAQFLLGATGTAAAPAFWVMVAAVASLAAVWACRNRQPQRD
ncbi:MFS transporter [Modestobacter sp. I12A-02628]|uniref:MFS transporter n=1 Tax=Goekera deserti TaxID=2497753 RepID=A0A7K3WFW4_9ACTN|nr:MFS transporter [Goekera deserti]MPQ96464.1 MFS transporter [Goekera deserti]NDI47221.1 MFS transporter [Goekera deserti]NEL55378.1 MFS transporter [Goekera deserti]